jgi:asparagine synthase (glutamine-hydrolysing)
MCGICGIVDFSGQLPLVSAVRDMAHTLQHRGPDFENARACDQNADSSFRVALGHTRLAIIDLSDAGRQPMRGRGGLEIVLNGEIYNFQEKRSQCADYPFCSRTDTEVILALYEKYGEEFVSHIDGMFALALWDPARQKLVLARDRAGKKPLFYVHNDRFFAFASEIKALLKLPGFSPKLSKEALPLYLTYGYVPTPDTFFEEVKKLEPATLMVVEAGKAPRRRVFWSYPLEKAANPISLDNAEKELRILLRNSVARRMISDVPLGAFLSGGIDSSIIVGIMSDLSGSPVKTFSIGFEGDDSYDETPFARIVSSLFKTQHTEFRVKPNAIDLVEKLVWHHDEPFGDSSAIPTYMVSKLTRDCVTVALSGDGGDELFAGYERFAAAIWSERIPKALLSGGRLVSRFLPAPAHAKSLRRRVKRFLDKAVLPFPEKYLEWNSFFSRYDLQKLLGAQLQTDVAASFEEHLTRASNVSLLQKILYLNYRTYLLDDLLVKTDRVSMAHGLEVRCPFLDTQLVEWAALLPDNMKIRGGTLKYILKRAYRDLLPEVILNRRKMGFGVPLGAWMRKDLKDYSHDVLLGPSAKICTILSQEAIRFLIREHLEQVQDHGQKIWALLCLEVWLRSLSARA